MSVLNIKAAKIDGWKDEFLYAVFVICIGSVKSGQELTVIPPMIRKAVIVIGCTALLIKLVITRYSLKELLITAGICIVGVMNMLYTGQMGILLIAFLILGAKNIELRRLFIMILISQICIFMIGVFPDLIKIAMGGHLTGIYHNRDIYGIIEVENQFRACMGFGHPNGLQQNITFISMLVIYLFCKEIKIWQLSAIVIFNLIFYSLTHSNTGLTIFILFLVLYLLWKKCRRVIDFLGKYSKYLFLLLVACNIVLVYFYSSSGWLEKLNHIMVGRLYWANNYLMQVPLSAWGENIYLADIPYKVVDNGYIFTLLSYGGIAFILYCVGIFWLCHTFYKQKKLLEILILVVIHVYFIMENFMMSALLNYSYAFFAVAIYSSEFTQLDDLHTVCNRILNRRRHS